MSDTIEEKTSHEGVTTRPSRFQPSEGLKQDAKGAVKTVVDILAVAASMTQNVPYLGIISGALKEFLKIQDEVNAFKSDWKSVMAVARQILAIVDKVREKCEKRDKGDEALPSDLVEPFVELEKCILNALETLNACKASSKRLKDRARAYINRGDLSNSVKQCRDDMRAALELFNMKLHIINAFALDGLLSKLPAVSAANAPIPFVIRLPPAPSIFYGRDTEVDQIVETVLHQPSVHVAILGSGGIGKTSIALTALHHTQIEGMFAERRFFMSCESTSTCEGMILELLKVFRLVYDPQSKALPEDILLSHLHTLENVILCIDNLETPWDSDVQAVEAFLSQLTALPRLALLVTARGTDRPMHVRWTTPFLTPIAPLTLDAALQTWDAISGSHDEYTVNLLEAVDCVPLAVSLLARLSQSESPEALWIRWNDEHTELLRSRGPDHRLTSVDVSIQVSLHSPRLLNEETPVKFFRALCVLPQGVPESRIDSFARAFKNQVPKLRRAITLLKQCALVYLSEDGFLRVLSPISQYMRTYHPVSNRGLVGLARVYCNLVDVHLSRDKRVMYRSTADSDEDQDSDSESIADSDSDREWDKVSKQKAPDSDPLPQRDLTDLKANLLPERKNVAAVLTQSLKRRLPYLYKLIYAVIAYTTSLQRLYLYDPRLIEDALEVSGTLPACSAKLWLLKAEGLHLQQGSSNDAMIAFQFAYLLHILSLDDEGAGHCLERMGDIYFHLGKIDEAKAKYFKAVKLYEDSGCDDVHKAGALMSLGTLHLRVGRLNKCEQYLACAWAIYHHHHEKHGEAHALNTLGTLYIRLGAYEPAEKVFNAARDLFTASGDKLGLANNFHCLGMLLIELKRYDEAETPLQSALELNREIGNQLGEVNALSSLGLVATCVKKYDEARTLLQSAYELAVSIEYVVGEGLALDYLGRVHRECNEIEQAKSCLQDATRILEEAQHAHGAESARQALRELGVAIEPYISDNQPTSTGVGPKPDTSDTSDDTNEEGSTSFSSMPAAWSARSIMEALDN